MCAGTQCTKLVPFFLLLVSFITSGAPAKNLEEERESCFSFPTVVMEMMGMRVVNDESTGKQGQNPI